VTAAKRGLVVGVDLKKIVILTPSGEFLAVKLAKGESIPKIGEEYILQSQGAFNVKNNLFLKYAALVAILLVMVLLPFSKDYTVVPSHISLSQLDPYFQLDSYLVIDINPSVELGLDKNQYVRTAKALNQDGEQVLQNADVLGKPLKTVVKQIIDTSVELGYLKQEAESQNIIFTYVQSKADTGEIAGEVISEKVIVEEVNSSLAEKSIRANVETIVTSTNTRQEADKLGLSTGKYIVYREAIANGLAITPEELRAESLEKAITKSGGNLKQLLKQAKKHQLSRDWDEKIFDELDRNIKKMEVKDSELEMESKKRSKNSFTGKFPDVKSEIEKEKTENNNKLKKENQQLEQASKEKIGDRKDNDKSSNKGKSQWMKNGSINLKAGEKAKQKKENDDWKKSKSNKKKDSIEENDNRSKNKRKY